MREIVTLERMHQAFALGLMEYGLIAGKKVLKPAESIGAAKQAVGASA